MRCVRRHCVRLSNLRFYRKAARSDTQTLDSFFSTQIGTVDQIKQTMRSLTLSIKDCVTAGCRAFMDAAKFSSGLDEEGSLLFFLNYFSFFSRRKRFE